MTDNKRRRTRKTDQKILKNDWTKSIIPGFVENNEDLAISTEGKTQERSSIRNLHHKFPSYLADKAKQLKFKLICDEPTSLTMDQFMERMKNLMGYHGKVRKVRHGITKGEAIEVQQLFGLSMLEFCEILQYSYQSLYGRKDEDFLDFNASDRLMALMSVHEEGYRVFGNRIDFFQWLRTPLSALNGNPPLCWLTTLVGMEEVKYQIFQEYLKSGK